ncbi:hypothetical protein QQG91_06235 [Marivivens sp. LCG002]|uniref:hypothetical protein n=1 Tax=Marivivens sp. LCG002 TaxID=3051171 RepID=UPI002556065C|nr:hypothetical protein [Marivivens sp. LCG002]WIV52035.1 hypothetical protein QQG91_06235 [Marivivens sp. LCG002]
MKRYILDTCVDIKPDQANYPKYFFDDLKSSKFTVKIVIGGSKCLNEIATKRSLAELVNYLSDIGRVIKIEKERVDSSETEIRERILRKFGKIDAACDDLHIFALARESNCLYVISRDDRMAKCRDIIRNNIGHKHCPNIKIIASEETYKMSKV